ncbi:TPT domain containing protein [Amanita muscaria]
MQNNQRHPNISFSHSSRTSEKQRFSLKGYSTNGSILPIHQEKFQNHDYLSAFWAVFWNTQKRISHFIQQRQRAVLSSHPKDLTSSTSPHSTIKFVFLCALWYSSSALSSNTGKAILNQFRYPVTLTFVQFGFVALYCLLSMSPLVRFTRIRAPSKAILKTTLPMGMFQVGGHMFSSMAISRIPVSTVHTIKALSPLFTVAAYALLFGVSYSNKTYISLLPLTAGVMLACSFDVSASSALGLLCAFGSALIFVSSNIFFKKIMPSNASGPSTTSHKLDKLNLLLYSSGMAFLLTLPMWIYYDLPILLSGSFHPEYGLPKSGQGSPHSVTYYFFVNGTVHFAQNIIAFIILSSTSPVTYSIASLIKRVVVICMAIVWFQQRIHPIQGIGILMTFVGLYMYNQSKSDVEKGEQKMRRVDAARALILPTTKQEGRLLSGTSSPPAALKLQSQYGVPLEPLASASALERAPSLAPTSQYHPALVNSHQQIYPTSAGLKVDPNSVFHSSLSHTKDRNPSTSPVDSYPSPPPSTGSPSSRSHSLEEVAQQADSAIAVR